LAFLRELRFLRSPHLGGKRTHYLRPPVARRPNAARIHQPIWTTLVLAAGCASATYQPLTQTGAASVPPCATDAVTIRAARLLDGRGGAFANAVVSVRGDTIAAVDACAGPVTHDLGDVTLLPGFIDVHVHIDWHFRPMGASASGPAGSRKRR